jgi:hypothetical protein
MQLQRCSGPSDADTVVGRLAFTESPRARGLMMLIVDHLALQLLLTFTLKSMLQNVFHLATPTKV